MKACKYKVPFTITNTDGEADAEYVLTHEIYLKREYILNWYVMSE